MNPFRFYVLNIGLHFEPHSTVIKTTRRCFYVLNIGLHFELDHNIFPDDSHVSMS